MQKVGDIVKKIRVNEDKQSLPLEYSRDKYISREFQKYGYELALELGDLKNKSLYIKLAKETPRGLMEAARSFVKDAQNAKNKGALYMWKLKQIKTEKQKSK